MLSLEDKSELILGFNTEAHVQKVGEAVELAMFTFFKSAGKDYRIKFRSLHFNLKVLHSQLTHVLITFPESALNAL
jgi:hypothetical protein